MICLAILLISGPAKSARAASPWRFWTKADGLRESVVFGLTSRSDGRILVKFGAVPGIADSMAITFRKYLPRTFMVGFLSPRTSIPRRQARRFRENAAHAAYALVHVLGLPGA